MPAWVVDDQAPHLSRSRSLDALDPRLVMRALSVDVHRNLQLTSAAVAGLFLFLAAAHAMVLEEASATIMVPSAIFTSLGGFGVWVFCRRTAPSPASEHVAGALGALGMLNSAMMLLLTNDPIQSTNMMLLLIACASVFLSQAWLIGLFLSGSMVYAVAWHQSAGGPTWNHFAFALLFSGIATMLIQSFRTRTLTELHSARLMGERQRDLMLTSVESSRRSEARYRELVQIVPGAMLVVRSRRDIVLINRAGMRLLGAGMPDQLARGFDAFLDPVDARRIMRWMEALEESDLGPSHTESRIRQADGTLIDVEIVGVRVPSAGKNACQLLIHDVSERRRLERLKDDFISVVSHELRTPLAAILGALKLAEAGAAGPVPEQLEELLEVASRNGERLLNLINDILDLQRLESGAMSTRKLSIDLVGAVEQAIRANEPLGKANDVKLHLGRADHATIKGDPQRLQQVFANLLSNAVKFSPNGGVVTLEILRVGSGRVCVAVRDQGSGIPAEFQPRLFQRFAQANSTATRAAGGTGLGLYICREIVERHDGEIRYQTGSSGTTFYVELPEITSVGDSSAPAG